MINLQFLWFEALRGCPEEAYRDGHATVYTSRGRAAWTVRDTLTNIDVAGA
jgi:hypothetical protein